MTAEEINIPQHRGYTGKATRTPPSMTWHGRVRLIRDVVTFRGDSLEDLVQTFKDSVDDYLALCEEKGETPSESWESC